MPFGKYRGQPIASLPRPYLQWVLDNVHDLYPDTREAIQGALRGPQREREGVGQGAPAKAPARRQRARHAPDSEGCGHVCEGCGVDDGGLLVVRHPGCMDGGDGVPF